MATTEKNYNLKLVVNHDSNKINSIGKDYVYKNVCGDRDVVLEVQSDLEKYKHHNVTAKLYYPQDMAITWGNTTALSFTYFEWDYNNKKEIKNTKNIKNSDNSFTISGVQYDIVWINEPGYFGVKLIQVVGTGFLTASNIEVSINYVITEEVPSFDPSVLWTRIGTSDIDKTINWKKSDNLGFMYQASGSIDKWISQSYSSGIVWGSITLPDTTTSISNIVVNVSAPEWGGNISSQTIWSLDFGNWKTFSYAGTSLQVGFKYKYEVCVQKNVNVIDILFRSSVTDDEKTGAKPPGVFINIEASFSYTYTLPEDSITTRKLTISASNLSKEIDSIYVESEVNTSKSYNTKVYTYDNVCTDDNYIAYPELMEVGLANETTKTIKENVTDSTLGSLIVMGNWGEYVKLGKISIKGTITADISKSVTPEIWKEVGQFQKEVEGAMKEAVGPNGSSYITLGDTWKLSNDEKYTINFKVGLVNWVEGSFDNIVDVTASSVTFEVYNSSKYGMYRAENIYLHFDSITVEHEIYPSVISFEKKYNEYDRVDASVDYEFIEDGEFYPFQSIDKTNVKENGNKLEILAVGYGPFKVFGTVTGYVDASGSITYSNGLKPLAQIKIKKLIGGN